MAWTQHILSYADYIAAGGDPPKDYAPTADTVVVVCQDDATRRVAWVSYAEESMTPVAERLNTGVPAQDWRP